MNVKDFEKNARNIEEYTKDRNFDLLQDFGRSVEDGLPESISIKGVDILTRDSIYRLQFTSTKFITFYYDGCDIFCSTTENDDYAAGIYTTNTRSAVAFVKQTIKRWGLV